ncbi:hypothetical protein PQG46_00085 [Aquirufa nivalisilvae]
MPDITFTYEGALLRFQHLSIKNARTQEIICNNLQKQDTFHLPPGNHIIEIRYRFNIFLYPSSRFSLDVPEGRHLYFDLKEKEIAHYLIAQLLIILKLAIGYIAALVFQRDLLNTIWGALIVATPILTYNQIRILILRHPWQRLSNGYLELRHAWEY